MAFTLISFSVGCEMGLHQHDQDLCLTNIEIFDFSELGDPSEDLAEVSTLIYITLFGDIINSAIIRNG